MSAKEMKRARVLVQRATVALSDAARILSGLGHEGSARSMRNAQHEAATALVNAESAHDR